VIYSIGHSNRTLAAFLSLLQMNEIAALVDIRQFTRSRANPQFNADSLAPDLAKHGIAYRHVKELGGRRGSKLKPSPNGLWENESFRNYADYALEDEFEVGLEQLLHLVGQRSVAMMCAEAVWWRCHRRIVIDYLLTRDHAVRHILGESEPKAATVTPGAEVRSDGKVLYPPREPLLL